MSTVTTNTLILHVIITLVRQGIIVINPAIIIQYGKINCFLGYILLNLSSTVSVFAVGALLGKISALWLLSACALAYLIGMIWYMILYKKYMRN